MVEPSLTDSLKNPVLSRKKREKECEQYYKQGLHYFEGKNSQRNFKKAVKVFLLFFFFFFLFTHS